MIGYGYLGANGGGNWKKASFGKYFQGSCGIRIEEGLAKRSNQAPDDEPSKACHTDTDCTIDNEMCLSVWTYNDDPTVKKGPHPIPSKAQNAHGRFFSRLLFFATQIVHVNVHMCINLSG